MSVCELDERAVDARACVTAASDRVESAHERSDVWFDVGIADVWIA